MAQAVLVGNGLLLLVRLHSCKKPGKIPMASLSFIPVQWCGKNKLKESQI
jgi:hypothetical protein